MRHLSAGGTRALIDSTADLLIRYATLINQQRTADSIELNGYTTAGVATALTLLINDGLTLVTELVVTDLPDPDNQAADRYLQSHIEALLLRQNPPYDDVAGTHIWNRQ